MKSCDALDLSLTRLGPPPLDLGRWCCRRAHRLQRCSLVEDEHRGSVTHEHQDAVKTTRSRRHGQDACVSTHAARSVRWCYLTGRCAYLPSVTCYRQSIKPLLLLLQVFYTWVARSRSGSSSFTASALNKPSSSSSSSLPPSLALLLFPSSPFSVPCPSVPTLLFPPRCSGCGPCRNSRGACAAPPLSPLMHSQLAQNLVALGRKRCSGPCWRSSQTRSGGWS